MIAAAPVPVTAAAAVPSQSQAPEGPRAPVV